MYKDSTYICVRSLKLRHGRVDALDNGTVDLLHRFREKREHLDSLDPFLL